jgi:hypothetical protein
VQRSKQHFHSITSSAEQRLRDFEAERLRGLEINGGGFSASYPSSKPRLEPGFLCGQAFLSAKSTIS